MPPASPPPVDVREPQQPLSPLVFASPHSGSDYPVEFVASAALDLATLRKSEDCFVDELFSDAPAHGAPLVRALLPRAYLDVNREPYELDPDMFDTPLPPHVNAGSARVAAGLGTIARIVASRREIYRDKLSFTEAERRIADVYRPYHQALRAVIQRARERFGFCILIDCHSMPSTGLPLSVDSDMRTLDIVLGDRAGLSCHGGITDTADETLAALGYRVVRNNPYAGGFTTQHYGDPSGGIHVLQVEINRALYMDEITFARRPAFDRLKSDLNHLMRRLQAFAGGFTHELTYQRLSAE
ncbi:MAG: N-formylglutamate amidohydrolase [Rhodospirillaceae bacterium]|nr:N-formylglutamate amidohydrolase [Rhodospirillaceae bacterium]